MGSPINLGDRIFKTRNQGSSLTKVSELNKVIRWTTIDQDISTLALPSSQISVNALLPVSVNSSIVQILSIIPYARFIDSSVGSEYNVSDIVLVYFDKNNLVSFDGQFSPFLGVHGDTDNYTFSVQVNSARQIPISYQVFGGDVLMKTGITPAASDQIASKISVSYISFD